MKCKLYALETKLKLLATTKFIWTDLFWLLQEISPRPSFHNLMMKGLLVELPCDKESASFWR